MDQIIYRFFYLHYRGMFNPKSFMVQDITYYFLYMYLDKAYKLLVLFVCWGFFAYIQHIKFDLGPNEKLVQIILFKETSSKIFS